MSLKKQIADWFAAGCHFHDGLELLRATGGDVRPFFRAANSASPDDYSRQKLRDALNLVVLRLVENPVYDSPAVEEKSTAFNNEITEPKSGVFQQKTVRNSTPEPEEIVALRERARQLHKRHSFLHAQLLPAPDAKKRFAIAREIMEEVLPALDEIYDTIRKWEATGETPTPGAANDVVQETVKKMLRLSSLESRISRLKGLIKSAQTDKAKSDYEKELLTKQVELADLKRELNL